MANIIYQCCKDRHVQTCLVFDHKILNEASPFARYLRKTTIGLTLFLYNIDRDDMAHSKQSKKIFVKSGLALLLQ